MKSSNLRACVALACTLALSACGGSGGDLLLSASVSGLTKDGLVLQNKGANDLTVPANATTVSFAGLIATDSDYNVTIKPGTGPSNADCTVPDGKGNSGPFNVTVHVVCTIHTHELKGNIAGLGDAAGLVLVNGSDRVTVAANATEFTMAKVAEELPYGLTILTQPTGRNCSVANGVGKMGTTDVTGVQVNCVANP
jgi:hypothetical protein